MTIVASPEPARTEPAYVLPAAPIPFVPHTAADLMVGDFLTLPDREVVVTRVETAPEGVVVSSGMWAELYTSTWPVTASAGRLRMRRIAEQAAAVTL